MLSHFILAIPCKCVFVHPGEDSGEDTCSEKIFPVHGEVFDPTKDTKGERNAEGADLRNSDSTKFLPHKIGIYDPFDQCSVI